MENYLPPLGSKSVLKSNIDKKQVLERGLETECMHRREGSMCPMHREGPHDKARATQGPARSGHSTRGSRQHVPVPEV